MEQLLEHLLVDGLDLVLELAVVVVHQPLENGRLVLEVAYGHTQRASI